MKYSETNTDHTNEKILKKCLLKMLYENKFRDLHSLHSTLTENLTYTEKK